MASGAAGGQTIHPATVSALVTDAGNAPVACALVVLEPGTGSKDGALRGTTGPDGRFLLMAVEGETYTLTVTVPGFKNATALVVGGKRVPTVQLQMAEVAEHVEVTAPAGQGTLDPGETEGGIALERDTIAAIPLNGRSFTDELAVTPGVVPISSAQPNEVVMSGVASTPPLGNLDIGELS